MRMHNPAHRGTLLADYNAGGSVNEVAQHLGVPHPTLSRVLNGKAAILAVMALRISEAFNTEADFWLRLQAQCDLWIALQQRRTRLKPLPALKAA